MAIFRFVADVHVGNHRQFGGEVVVGVNNRCRRILSALDFACDNSNGSVNLVVLGDLFDTSNPSPQVIRATMDATLRAWRKLLLLGNHDMVSEQPGDHALAPFRSEPSRCDYYDQPELLTFHKEVTLLMVPFRPAPMVDWFAETVGSLVADATDHEANNSDLIQQRVVCFHGGVRDHNTPKFLWSSPDAIDVDLLFDTMKRAGVRLALCGNWHNHRVWKRDGMTVIQVGALVPTGFDNEGWDYGYCVELNTNTGLIEVLQLPTARFLALTLRQVQQQADRILNHAGGVYLKVKLSKGETQESVTQELQSLGLTLEDSLLGLVFAAYEENTAQQEMEAAEAARTADTLESALREYVQAMPLSDGVAREAVESKVLNYVARE